MLIDVSIPNSYIYELTDRSRKRNQRELLHKKRQSDVRAIEIVSHDGLIHCSLNLRPHLLMNEPLIMKRYDREQRKTNLWTEEADGSEGVVASRVVPHCVRVLTLSKRCVELDGYLVVDAKRTESINCLFGCCLFVVVCSLIFVPA